MSSSSAPSLPHTLAPAPPPPTPPLYFDDIRLSDEKSSSPTRTFAFLLSLLHQPILLSRLDPHVTSVVQSPTDPNVYTITDSLIKARWIKIVYDACFTPLFDGMEINSEGPYGVAPFKIVWKVVETDVADPKDPGRGKCRVSSVEAEARVVGWLKFFVQIIRLEESVKKLLKTFESRVKEEAHKKLTTVTFTELR